MEVDVAATRNTGPTTVHTLDVRLSVLESRYETIDEKLDRLLEASGQGHPPTPKRARPKSPADDSGEDVPVRKGVWGVLPGTGKEIAIALSALTTVISSLMAVYYAATAGPAAYQGANQAVEDAVEQAEAVPVAAPVVRVMPVPVPHPVPVPTPAPPEPEPVTRPDDLLPQEM